MASRVAASPNRKRSRDYDPEMKLLEFCRSRSSPSSSSWNGNNFDEGTSRVCNSPQLHVDCINPQRSNPAYNGSSTTVTVTQPQQQFESPSSSLDADATIWLWHRLQLQYFAAIADHICPQRSASAYGTTTTTVTQSQTQLQPQPQPQSQPQIKTLSAEEPYYTSSRIELLKTAVKNSLVQKGGEEAEYARKTMLIRLKSHRRKLKQHRCRLTLQGRPSRLSIMSKAQP